MRSWLLLALLVALALLWWRQSPDAPLPARHAPPADAAGSGPPKPAAQAASPAGLVVGSATGADRPPAGNAPSATRSGREVAHAFQDARACLANTARDARPDRQAIHRWEDAQGIVHFSDQAPDRPARGHRLIEAGGLPSVVVKATGFDVNLPDFVSQRAVADAQAIGRVLRDSLEVAGDPGLVLDIEFIASAESYARRVGSPLLAGTDGAYSSRDRTIRVRLQDDDESNFLVLRHEIAHALIHERIGNLPTAINEGLASYLERVRVSGMGAQVVVDDTREGLRDAAFATDGAEEIVDLLARDGADFYAAGREQRYRRAFALVAVLMARPEGRHALGAVLVAQRADPCRPVGAGRILDRNYPGGLATLAAEWARWLRDPVRSTQAY